MIRRHLRATRIDTLLRPTTLFQSDPQQPEGQGSLPGRGGRSMSALLALEGVHAHYGKSHILHGVDFHVAPGEVVSLLGRNGSGRPTTMKTIRSEEHPSELQSLMRTSYAVFCLKKKKHQITPI